MSWHTIDGGLVPDALAGPLVLDFCNTRAGWGASTPPTSRLDPSAFAVWAHEHGLVRRVAPTKPAVRRRALALRATVHRCCTGHATGADWALLTAEARRGRQASSLAVDPSTGVAAWRIDADGPERALAVVAEAAVELLTSPLAASIGCCPGNHCGWLFVDPRGRRRWCSMALCGNRVKARRHAARQRA